MATIAATTKASPLQPEGLRSRLLVLTGLATVALSVPIFDIYGRNPEVFVVNRSTAWEIVGFALIVCLAAPVLLGSVLWAATRHSERWANRVYLGEVAFLAVLAGFGVARPMATTNQWIVVLVVVLVVAAVLTILNWAGELLVWSVVALPISLLAFLFWSPSAVLIWGDRSPAPPPTTVAEDYSVLLVQLDELPLASLLDSQGEVNGDLFPGFARLTNRATWYRNALADSIATSVAIPATLTGIRSDRALSPTYLDHSRNLFTMLAGQRSMNVVEWIANLCPPEECTGPTPEPAPFRVLLSDAVVVYLHLILPQGLSGWLPSITNSWSGFLGEEPPPSAQADPSPIRWVDNVSIVEAGIHTHPTLSYIHLQAPHVPWLANPTGSHYQRPEQYSEVEGVGEGGLWISSPGAALIGFQRHLYQLGLVDRQLSRLLDRIEDLGMWDQTMIVVTADHGASFVPGEHRRWPYDHNRDDLYRIPLIVKYPGQQDGEVIDQPAFGIDILPTIVDVLGVSNTWEYDGVSLRELSGSNRQHEPIWWCCSREGVDTDLAILHNQVQRNHSWLPNQTSWLGVAGLGPWADHIGASVEDVIPVIGPNSGQGVEFTLSLGGTLLDRAGEGGLVQTYLSGRYRAGFDPSDALFVVNGKVAGVAWTVRDATDGGRFSGMIAEELVEPGSNQVSLLLQRDHGTWVRAQSGEVSLDLRGPSGEEMEIEPEGARRLQIDRAEWRSEQLVLVGWAADVVAKQPPDLILVFAGNQLLVSSQPNRENRNVVAWFDSDDLLNSGFDLRVDQGDIPLGIEQLTVVALFGDRGVAEPANLPIGE